MSTQITPEALKEAEAIFLAEYGHPLSLLLDIVGFDLADRDAQILECLKRETAQ